MPPLITGESRLPLAVMSSPAPAELRAPPCTLALAPRRAGVPGGVARSRMAA